MIKEAILALHERTGSSPQAIARYIEERYKGVLPGNFRKFLAIQLRNFAAKGKLVKIKASFKLSESGKKVEKKAINETKPKPRKTKEVVKGKAGQGASTATALGKRKAAVAPKTSAVPVKPSLKKVKKTVRVKSKKPKSIKSPAVKKARK